MESVSVSPKVLEPELKKIRILFETSVLKSKVDWENYRTSLKEEAIKYMKKALDEWETS